MSDDGSNGMEGATHPYYGYKLLTIRGFLMIFGYRPEGTRSRAHIHDERVPWGPLSLTHMELLHTD